MELKLHIYLAILAVLTGISSASIEEKATVASYGEVRKLFSSHGIADQLKETREDAKDVMKINWKATLLSSFSQATSPSISPEKSAAIVKAYWLGEDWADKSEFEGSLSQVPADENNSHHVESSDEGKGYGNVNNNQRPPSQSQSSIPRSARNTRILKEGGSLCMNVFLPPDNVWLLQTLNLNICSYVCHLSIHLMMSCLLYMILILILTYYAD